MVETNKKKVCKKNSSYLYIIYLGFTLSGVMKSVEFYDE